MLTIKKPNSSRGRQTALWIALLLAVAGCAPPGPRALLKGEKLIQRAKYSEAVGQLQTATRLLPNNANAWNYLGLAYYGAGQVSNAVTAYRRALKLDRDLTVVHYNLGCLWLEQNNPSAAIEALNSYVQHPRHTKEVAGWMKLGTALMRAQRWDEAEKVFNYCLHALNHRAPELWNNLGVIQVRDRHFQDAISCFKAALTEQTNYAPALLNLAATYHKEAENRDLALEKYREYLALNPRPNDADAVAEIAQKLDAELNPSPTPLVETNQVVKTFAPTNTPPAETHATSEVPTNAVEVASSKTPSPPPEAPQKEPDPPKPPPSKAKPTAPPSPPLKDTDPTPATPPAEAPKIEISETVREKPVTIQLKPVEATRTAEGLVITPVQDSEWEVPIPPPLSHNTSPRYDPSLANIGKPPPPEPKRSFWAKFNPFKKRPQTSDKNNPATVEPTRPETLEAATKPAPPQPRRSDSQPVRAEPLPPIVPRYKYLAPAPPTAGDRPAAKRYFLQGLQLQRAGDNPQALGFYERALQLDPAYFAAHYNRSLANFALKDLQQALTSGEYALALEAGSVDARYQFALSLRQAGYYLDAVAELKKILETVPDESRALLTLANIYAQQLSQPDKARAYYLELLDKNPNHPEGLRIRHWLAVNP